MKQLNDQDLRGAFLENDEKPIGVGFGKEDLWLRIEQQLPHSRKLHPNWYRSAAAILVLVVLSGWSITLMRYNHIQTINKQLSVSIEEMKCILELQKKQSAESLTLPGKVECKITNNVGQLLERKMESNYLLSENTRLKAEREILISANASINKQLNFLSRENIRWADSLRLVTAKISSTKERPHAEIETPLEPESPKVMKIGPIYTPNVKTEVYMSGLGDKRRGRRLRIQIFSPGEPVDNHPANDVGIFKLFK